MVNSATGLLAGNDVETPRRALVYLAASQQRDGGFPQNFWLDGTPYWRGIQLDEVAFPVILAWRLWKAEALGEFDPYPMVNAAAAYLVRQGPMTQLTSQENRMEMQTERIFFRGHTDSKLAARLDRPTGEPVSCALFAHCFTCSKDYHAVSRISRALAAQGIAVLRFDFTGLGESEGDFADTNFSSNLDDLLAAARFLGERLGPPELLIGHSLGGSAVLAAARRIPESKAVVTIGAPCDPGHLRPILAGAAPAIETEGEAEVVLAGRQFRIKRQLLDDLREHSLRRFIGDLRKALLILHSPADKIVGIEHAHRIFEAAKHPKSFVAIEGADHLLADRAASDYVASVISAWAAWYIGRIK